MKSANGINEDELVALEAGTLDPMMFPHREHVRLGYEMLERYSFGEAVDRFSRGLRRMATNCGRPERFHATITIAFLSLIGERRGEKRYRNWTDFEALNSDLLDKSCLERWYAVEQLNSDLARQTFCLPQPRE